MKKALLLVLVLAFLLVPVFSSAVSAAGVADWTIGDGMNNADGDQVPLKLEATKDGMVVAHVEGAFADKAKAGIWMTEGWDVEELEEISITISLDEYNNILKNNMTGKYEPQDAWFKFTLMNEPDSLVLFNDTTGMQGLAFSIAQDVWDWGVEVPRLRVWVEEKRTNIKWVDDDENPDTPNVQDGYFTEFWRPVEGSVWASWEGMHLGEDVTIKLTRKYNPDGRGDQNVWIITAELGGFEQIIAAGYNLDGVMGWPNGGSTVYPGFIIHNNLTNYDKEMVGPMVYEEDTDEIRIKDAIYVNGELSLDVADYKAADATIKALVDAAAGEDEVDGIKVRKNDAGDVTHVYCVFQKKAGETAQDENWGEIPDPDGKPKYTFPEKSISATVKWLNGEWMGTGEAPSTATVAPTAAPTETPDIDQTGQDFTLAIVLGSMAAMLAIAGAVVMVNKSRA